MTLRLPVPSRATGKSRRLALLCGALPALAVAAPALGTPGHEADSGQHAHDPYPPRRGQQPRSPRRAARRPGRRRAGRGACIELRAGISGAFRRPPAALPATLPAPSKSRRVALPCGPLPALTGRLAVAAPALGAPGHEADSGQRARDRHPPPGQQPRSPRGPGEGPPSLRLQLEPDGTCSVWHRARPPWPGWWLEATPSRRIRRQHRGSCR